MSFTTESINTPNPNLPAGAPLDATLPSKTFIGYDTKGTTTITNSPNEHPGQPNVKQRENSEGRQTGNPTPEAQASSSPKEESVTLSPKVSAIARKEAALRQREKDL